MPLEPTAAPAVQGHCYAFFAFDVGLSIALEPCDRAIKEATERTRLRRDRKSPSYFDYDPPPLRMSQQGHGIQIGEYQTNAAVDITLFDFGAVSVCYTLDYTCAISDLIGLSDKLYGNTALLQDARDRVDQLVSEIKEFITKPLSSGVVEDYTVYEVSRLDTADWPTFLKRHGAEVAQILRSETESLSEEEINDAISTHISYGSLDLAVVDWNAAFIVGEGTEDVRAVLEFGNVDLLEMRFLDKQLDEALEEASRALTSGKKLPASLRKIAELQVENAMLFEAVNNALKLTGDQYLARVYSIVTKRLHLSDWDASILRKLSALDSIYHKISDRADQRRSEFLEWVIIALITFEVIYSLFGRH